MKEEVKSYIEEVVKPHINMFRDHNEYLMVDNLIGDFKKIMDMDTSYREEIQVAKRYIETYYGNKQEVIDKLEDTIRKIYYN